MTMSEDGVQLTIGRAEALVLFEMLADFYSQSCLQIADPAERLALVRLHGVLEKALVEPFLPEYQDLVHDAKTSLESQFGGT